MHRRECTPSPPAHRQPCHPARPIPSERRRSPARKRGVLPDSRARAARSASHGAPQPASLGAAWFASHNAARSASGSHRRPRGTPRDHRSVRLAETATHRLPAGGCATDRSHRGTLRAGRTRSTPQAGRASAHRRPGHAASGSRQGTPRAGGMAQARGHVARWSRRVSLPGARLPGVGAGWGLPGGLRSRRRRSPPRPGSRPRRPR